MVVSWVIAGRSSHVRATQAGEENPIHIHPVWMAAACAKKTMWQSRIAHGSNGGTTRVAQHSETLTLPMDCSD